MESYAHQKNLEHYRRLIADSQLALSKHRVRHNELLRLLLEEEAKGPIAFPIRDTRGQRIVHYRRLLVRSEVAVPKDYVRHEELTKLLADELSKDMKPLGS
jgi:hypothetical protein